MTRVGLIPWIVAWLRIYLIPVCLFCVVLVSVIETVTSGVEPMPQHPPHGMSMVRDHVQLQWSKGNGDGELKLQVAVDDSAFSTMIVNKAVVKNTHRLKRLKPGRTYYWRLVRGGEPGFVSVFTISANALRY